MELFEGLATPQEPTPRDLKAMGPIKTLGEITGGTHFKQKIIRSKKVSLQPWTSGILHRWIYAENEVQDVHQGKSPENEPGESGNKHL